MDELEEQPIPKCRTLHMDVLLKSCRISGNVSSMIWGTSLYKPNNFVKRKFLLKYRKLPKLPHVSAGFDFNKLIFLKNSIPVKDWVNSHKVSLKGHLMKWTQIKAGSEGFSEALCSHLI